MVGEAAELTDLLAGKVPWMCALFRVRSCSAGTRYSTARAKARGEAPNGVFFHGEYACALSREIRRRRQWVHNWGTIDARPYWAMVNYKETCMPTANGNHRVRSAASAPTPRRAAAKARRTPPAPSRVRRRRRAFAHPSTPRLPPSAQPMRVRARRASCAWRPPERRAAPAANTRSRVSAATGGSGKVMYIAIIAGAVLAAFVFFFVGRALLGAFMSDGSRRRLPRRAK